MELSPYLEAIQKIPGTTPGEKYKTLNLIARSVIHAESSDKDAPHSAPNQGKSAYNQHVLLTDVPEILKPLVELEVAKQLRQPEVVAEALKSEDRVLFNRALKVKWFFDGTCNNFTNVNYFMHNIIPYISVHRRYSVLKALSKNLGSKNPQLVEEFYKTIAATYGEKQAKPLLLACSELFILNEVQSLNLYLSARKLNQMMQKSPTFLVNYCKQRGFVSNDPDLQFLIKKHAADFFTFISTSDYCRRISSKRTKALICNGVDELKNLPLCLLRSMSLRMLTKTLTKHQFESLVQDRLFPKLNYLTSQISLYNVLDFLRYYPEEEKPEFIYRSFEKLYPEKILEYHRCIRSDMLTKIPPELRVNYARKQVELCENSWDIENKEVEKCWICYLPIAESIPQIQSRIKISSKDTEDRCLLYEALIFTCYINSDKEALLTVLEYLAIHHKNERNSVIVPMLKRLHSSFDLPTLTLQHWKYINIFEDKFPNSLIVSKIHFNLIHCIPIDSLIELYMTKTSNAGPWNILINELHYEQQCLEKFFEKILAIRESNPEYWETNRLKLAYSVAEAIWNFNGRNLTATTNIPMMSIKNYPVVKSIVEQILFGEVLSLQVGSRWIRNCDWNIKLKLGEPDLYREYFPVEENLPSPLSSAQHVKNAMKILKKNPHEVLENWEKYYVYTENISSRARNHFFTTSLWYQDLPNKFAAKCLEDIAAGKKCGILAAASLFEGPLIGKAALAGSETIRDNLFWSIITCTKNFHRMNPQPSADTLLFYYKNDERNAAVFLTRVSECMLINKATECALELLKNFKVSVHRQGIQMMKKIATNSQVCDLLSTLLKSQQHKDINKSVYMHAKKMIYKYESQPWWLLWNECLNIITTADCCIIKDLIYDWRFPKRFIVPYVKKLFTTYQYLDSIKKLGELILGEMNFLENYTYKSLHELAFTGDVEYLPDEYNKEMLQTYFTKMNGSLKLWKIMEQYAYIYVVNMKNEIVETRMKFIINMVLPILKNYWNVSLPNDDNFYPSNSILDFFEKVFSGKVLFCIETERIIHETIESLSTVLSPLQMPSCCILLKLRSMTTYIHNCSEITQKFMPILSSLVEIYSEEGIPVIANFFYTTYAQNNLNHLLRLIEALLNLHNDISTKFAVSLLDIVYSKESHHIYKNPLYNNIIKSLVQSNNTCIAFKMNLHLHNCRKSYYRYLK